MRKPKIKKAVEGDGVQKRKRERHIEEQFHFSHGIDIFLCNSFAIL